MEEDTSNDVASSNPVSIVVELIADDETSIETNGIHEGATNSSIIGRTEHGACSFQVYIAGLVARERFNFLELHLKPVLYSIKVSYFSLLENELPQAV
uniref:Uncharacterized protein n=1 Tax=Angiostrongylus cantonensis TaxID=6313 RepID=A0A0K0CX35_ANGCA